MLGVPDLDERVIKGILESRELSPGQNWCGNVEHHGIGCILKEISLVYFLFLGTSDNIYRLYRGQHMTSNELKQIKDSVGHLIATNSFLSTTQYRNLAETWAGNGEDRPTLESVIFEITIDESEFGDISVIFADVTSESNFGEEGEVLLAMGTTLRIESVEPEGNIWKICFCACPFEDRGISRIKN